MYDFCGALLYSVDFSSTSIFCIIVVMTCMKELHSRVFPI